MFVPMSWMFFFVGGDKMPGTGLGVMLFNDEGKILLIKRNDDAVKAASDMHLEGTWTLPAGKIKNGETIFEAARRKAMQEVNLNIDDLSIISIADDINEYAHFITLGILARMWNGEINLGDTEEQVEYDWFDINDLPINLCEPSKNIIDNYLNNTIYKENDKNGKRKILY